MREKSQLEDMRAALRGDIERAQARRDADPWRAQEPEPVAEKPVSEGLTPEGSDPAETPKPDAVAEGAVPEGLTPEGSDPAETPEPEPAPVAEQKPATESEETVQETAEPVAASEPAPEPAPQDKGRPGFFARLFGRG